MSTTKTIPLAKLRQSIQSNFPELNDVQVNGALGAIAKFCDIADEDVYLDHGQEAKALKLIELIKSEQASDFDAANAILSGDVVNVPIPDVDNSTQGSDVVDIIDSEAKAQAYKIARSLAETNHQQKAQFRNGYDQLVLSHLPDALAAVRAEAEKKPEEPSASSSPTFFELAFGLSPGSSPATLPEGEQSQS